MIRHRSYAGGELPKLEQAVIQCTAALESAQTKLLEAKQRVAELDAKITALAPGIDPEDIRAQVLTPRLY